MKLKYESLVLDNVWSIGQYAFQACDSFTNVTLPKCLSTLCSYAFNECANLETISADYRLSRIGRMGELPALKEINIVERNTYLTMFDGCVYSGDLTDFVYAPPYRKGELNILDCVTIIKESAFEDNASLTKIVVPKSVELLEREAFCNLKNGQTIVFYNKDMDFYNSPESISSDVNCDDIKVYCYKGSYVENFCIKYNVEYHLLDEEELPIAPVTTTKTTTTTVTTTVTTTAAAPATTTKAPVTTAPAKGFTYTLDNSGNAVISGFNGEAEGRLEIPDTIDGHKVASIGSGAFKDCTKITSVRMPDTVKYLGVNAFKGCTSLESVKLSKGLDSIQSGTFSGCSTLRKIHIYKNASEIMDNAFEGCTSLEYALIDNPDCTLTDTAFTGCADGFTVRSAESSALEKQAAALGYEFMAADIAEIPLGNVDGAGCIDASDASKVLIIYALVSTGKESTLSDHEEDAADVNGDGKVDASDASLILQFYSYQSTGGEIEDMAEWLALKSK